MPDGCRLPDKPSIVVLPFTNMSADAEQAYFVDGLTEDLITDLSKVPELFVIARNSSFAFKSRSVDVRRVAQDLGVNYVLEGSARRAADRMRINAQLIDARRAAAISGPIASTGTLPMSSRRRTKSSARSWRRLSAS